MPTYASSVSRDLGDKLGELPSLRDYGAVGDGSADDTAAIAAGLSSVAARGGGHLLVDSGTYKITGPLTIPTGVILTGYGAKSVFTPVGTLSTGTGWFDITGTGAGLNNFTIEGGTTTASGVFYDTFGTPDFNDQPLDPVLTGNSSIWLHGGARDTVISRLTIRHTGGYSVLVDADSADINNTLIRDCLFENNRPHLFGTATGSLTHGAWTGGVLLRGDCRTSEAKNFAVKGAEISGCVWKRNVGNCLWMHSRGFDTHHTNVRFLNNSFEDCGLDAILVGNLDGGQVSGNVIRRVGYITTSDASASTPDYPVYTYAVGIDSSGYVNGVSITGNTLTSVNGGFIDLDGFRNGDVSNNTCSIPDSGTPDYTTDSIASYGTAGAVLTAGINLGNTSLNGGAADVQITNNTIRGCGAGALRLNYAKRCHVQGNTIYHPATAAEVPIPFFASGTTSETWVYDNSVLHNKITYAGPNFCIAETGSATSYGSATTTNTIFNNQIWGTNSGEFKSQGSSSSVVGCLFSSADSSLAGPVASFVQQIGTAASAALQFYGIAGTTKTYLAQLGHTGAVLNIGGTAGTGKVMTANRSSAGTGGDMVFSGKLIADGFLMLGGQTYSAAEANQFDESYGLVQYVEGTTGTGTFQLSKTVAAGTRVWEDLTFGSATAPGADKQITFNDGGAWGAVPEFTYDKTDNLLQVTANSTNTYGDPTLRVNFSNGSSAFDIDWGGYVQSTNASFIAKDAAANHLVSLDGNGADPGLRFASERIITWGSASNTPYTGTNLALGRAADGILQITNGTSTNYRDLRLRNLAAFGTAATSIQTTGGVTALAIIGTRTDNDDTFVLDGATRDYGLRIDASNQLQIYDRTAGAARFTLATNGQASFAGVAGQAALTLSTGYLNSAEGVVSANTAYNTFQASSGGAYLKNATLDDGLYLKTLGTLVDPADPGVGYAGLGHRTGSTYWYWNGSAWASVDLAASANTPPGADTQVIFNDALAYGASSKLTFAKTPAVLTVTGTAATASIVVTGGYIQSAQGFLTTSSASTAVNVASGGVTALSLISVRNDGAAGLTLSRSSATARDWGLGVNSSGHFFLSDVTGGANRLTIDTSGLISIGSTVSINQSGAITLSGVLTSSGVSGGVNVSGSTAYNSIQASGGGGMLARNFTSTTYIQVGQSAGAPTVTSGDSTNNGLLYYDTSLAALRARVAGSFITLGAATAAGSTTQVQYNSGGAFAGSSGLTFSSGILTCTSGFTGAVFNATNTGASITFQNSNSNFSVNGSGDVSAAGSFNSTSANPYKVGGTTIVDSSRNATFTTVTASGNIQCGSANNYGVAGGFFGQDATGGLVCGSHTLYFKGGILYAYT